MLNRVLRPQLFTALSPQPRAPRFLPLSAFLFLRFYFLCALSVSVSSVQKTPLFLFEP
jgi:hypothetical protein